MHINELITYRILIFQELLYRFMVISMSVPVLHRLDHMDLFNLFDS
jgi:hypothetical protein